MKADMRLTLLLTLLLTYIHVSQVSAQNSLADYEAQYDSLYKVRDYSTASQVVIDWENLAIQKHGEVSIERVRALTKKAIYVMQVEGNFPKAEDLLKQCIQITEQIGEVNTNEFAFLLLVTASVKQEQSKLSEAIPLFEKSLAIRTGLFGDEHLSTVFSKSRLAGAYLDVERYATAETLFLSSIAALERLHLQNHSLYLYDLRKYGQLLSNQNRFNLAIDYQKKCVSYAQDYLGGDSDDCYHALFSLARTYVYAGLLEEAEPIYRKLIQCQSQIISNNSLLALGTVQLRIGLYEDALENLLTYRDHIEKAPTTTAQDYAQLNANLSGAYFSKQQFEKADSLRNLAIEGYITNFGDTNSIYQNLLIEQAMSLAENSTITKAQDFLQEITAKHSAQFDADPFMHERILTIRGDICLREENYLKALNYYNQAIEINLEKSYNYYDNLLKKAFILQKLHDTEKLESTLLTLTKYQETKLSKNFSFLTDLERQEIYSHAKGLGDFLISAKFKNPMLSVNGTIFDFQIFTKSILENTVRKSREYLKNSNDSLVSASYARWVDAYELMNYAYSLSPEQIASNNLNIKTLEANTESFEKEITRLGIPFIPKEKLTRWQDIRDALQTNQAALDIARIQVYDGKSYQDTVLYLASVVRPDMKEPDIFFLENGNELESFVLAQYQNEIGRRKSLSLGLSASIWATIDSHLQGVKTLYFSPDGIFHKINLNTLQISDGIYLVDQMEIKQVTNLRNILQPNYQITTTETGIAALFGNPSFRTNMSTEALVTDLPASSSASLYRDIAEDANGNLHLEPLPGSQKEVEQIAKKLSAKNWRYEIFTGVDASEDAVKHVKSPKVLHIATHGYFLNSESKKNALGLVNNQIKNKPALRSMLFFAGAENSLTGERAGVNDGILTAYEAAVLNLDHTELVVLSACNTGLGKIQNGEGVYGLQRAFRIAGAKSLIMSLWEVEDAATDLLMNQFYENWLSGMSKTEAFHKSQLSLKAKYPQPFYWGSFILVNG